MNDTNPRSDYRLHALLFLIAISVRFLFLVRIDEPILFAKYPFFAEKLANGASIGDRLVDLSPFYLYFLAFIKKLFGVDWAFVKSFQVFIGAINALLILVIGNRLFERGAAFIGAILFALYGNMIVFETTLEPTVFVLLFSLLSIYILLISNNEANSQRKNTCLVLAAGLFAGTGIITKPNFLLFLPVAVAWILFFRNKLIGFKANLKPAVLYVLAALAIVAPITVRNYVKLTDFILVTADAGKVFFHGNSKSATAIVGADLAADNQYESTNKEPDYAHVRFRQTASRIMGKTLSPSASSRFWMELTLKDIASDPILYLRRELKKCIHFFTDYEVHYIASAYKEYKGSLSFPFLRYGMIVALGILGMIFSRNRFGELFLLYGSIAVYFMSCILFLVQSRYRIPAVPYFCLFGGHAIWRVKGLIRGRQFVSSLMGIGFFCAAYLSSHLLFQKDLKRYDRWQEATKICYEIDGRKAFQNGRYQEAIKALNKCVSLIPNFFPAYILKGKSHVMLRQLKRAEIDFREAISLQPESPYGYKNMGLLCLLQGEEEAAKEYFMKAIIRAPNDSKTKKALKDLQVK